MTSLLSLLSPVKFWLTTKRVCAWCHPNGRWIGGNPFARRTTHCICHRCLAIEMRSIKSLGRIA